MAKKTKDKLKCEYDYALKVLRARWRKLLSKRSKIKGNKEDARLNTKIEQLAAAIDTLAVNNLPAPKPVGLTLDEDGFLGTQKPSVNPVLVA